MVDDLRIPTHRPSHPRRRARQHQAPSDRPQLRRQLRLLHQRFGRVPDDRRRPRTPR
jgi:hypothetical protein